MQTLVLAMNRDAGTNEHDAENVRVEHVIVSESLDTLFRANYARLVRALAVVAGDQERAADAVQEAFVKAHLHWWRVKSLEDPVGWIRRVAINRLRDEHRRFRRKQAALARLDGLPRQHAVEPSAEADTAAMLASLPRQQRLAMALFYVDDLSVDEVATTLGISAGAVKFHLHQGRERLRGLHDTAGGSQ